MPCTYNAPSHTLSYSYIACTPAILQHYCDWLLPLGWFPFRLLQRQSPPHSIMPPRDTEWIRSVRIDVWESPHLNLQEQRCMKFSRYVRALEIAEIITHTACRNCSLQPEDFVEILEVFTFITSTLRQITWFTGYQRHSPHFTLVYHVMYHLHGS